MANRSAPANSPLACGVSSASRVDGPPDGVAPWASSIDTSPPWTRIARRQHGVTDRRQLLGSGLSPAELRTLIEEGLLLPQVRGVYRHAAAPATYEARLWVAALATRGTLIAPTACYLWQLDGFDTPAIRVAIPRSHARVAMPGVRVVRRDLPASETSTRWGLPVTTRATSVVEQISLGPHAAAVRLADRALQSGWIDLADLSRRLDSPHRGNPMIRRVLRTVADGAEAESERALHRLLRDAALTGWTPNLEFALDGRIVARIDVAFRAQRLAIEVDGFAYHSDSARFQRDRVRQNLLVTHGWTVLRFTWHDLTERPGYVIATIRGQLAEAA